MNETTLKELYELLISIDKGEEKNKIEVDEKTANDAKIALQRMMELS
jgi:quinolinate synthase